MEYNLRRSIKCSEFPGTPISVGISIWWYLCHWSLWLVSEKLEKSGMLLCSQARQINWQIPFKWFLNKCYTFWAFVTFCSYCGLLAYRCICFALKDCCVFRYISHLKKVSKYLLCIPFYESLEAEVQVVLVLYVTCFYSNSSAGQQMFLGISVRLLL